MSKDVLWNCIDDEVSTFLQRYTGDLILLSLPKFLKSVHTTILKTKVISGLHFNFNIVNTVYGISIRYATWRVYILISFWNCWYSASCFNSESNCYWGICLRKKHDRYIMLFFSCYSLMTLFAIVTLKSLDFYFCREYWLRMRCRKPNVSLFFILYAFFETERATWSKYHKSSYKYYKILSIFVFSYAKHFSYEKWYWQFPRSCQWECSGCRISN